MPERAVRLSIAVFLFALAVIFIFSFFENAGTAGELLFASFQFLLGKAVFLLPLFFVLAGLVLIGQKNQNKKPVFLAFFLLVIAITGIFGVLQGDEVSELTEAGGWIGFAVSWPLLKAFGFWVSGILFAGLGVISSIIFWQVLAHERIQEITLGMGAGEKIKKIFEPKFKVSEVAEEPEIRQAPPEPKKKEKAGEPTPVHALSLANYKLPPADLLEPERGAPNAGDVKAYSSIIKKTLLNFDIPVEMSEINIGPAVTQYAFKPSEGVKLARITALSNDLALALAAHPLRIEAPIPGRSLVGVEVPNRTRAVVRLRNLIEHQGFKDSGASLLLAFGKDVTGTPMFADLTRMPHLLVAGATGSGKTIFLNNIILSLLFYNSPDSMRFILVDPKRVEFPVYNELPHLLTPVILDTQKTVNILKWLVKEMERRFVVLSDAKKRNIQAYNVLVVERKAKTGVDEESMPYIVVIIDELADLMAARGKDIEGMIVRLAQMSRAVGIHLIIATQRPSVEVLTGLIKANITSRVAFQVASQIDSRTILDMAGAEKLLGQGDMLFISSEFSKPKRIQGAFVSDKDVRRVVEWIGNRTEDTERDHIKDDELSQSVETSLQADGKRAFNEDEDPLYEEAKRIVIESKKASASLLQRRLRLGYARAARLLDTLEDRHVVGPADGAKPREVFAQKALEEQDTKDKESPWVSP